MKTFNKLFKAAQELGFTKLWCYGKYALGLRSGHYRRVTPSRRSDYSGSPGLPPYQEFPQVSPGQKEIAIQGANEILEGAVRLFGAEPRPLDLALGASDLHWTDLERIPLDQDIKLIWEPARFGWAITLARAYAFSDDNAYAQDFWEKTLRFLEVHPPNLGRQWQSAQEVAIRLMVLVFCDRVFVNAPASTFKNRERLYQAIVEHARRIPPTLVYARAQNNNHLLSEAAGLYTAGLYLPDHPEASRWRELGWRWLNWGLQNQVSEFGTYTQHSANYHRLMLQVALYTNHLRRLAGEPGWPPLTSDRLRSAVRWLWALTDPKTGNAPNLGANDSAYPFPLSSLPYGDFRPVIDAAGKAFLDQDIYQQNELVEMADWFDLQADAEPNNGQPQAVDMLRIDQAGGRAFIRTAQFTDRPSHADQLHVDLWWQGMNVALDPGTYQYNTPPPWQNALAKTSVHNTLVLDGHDQMLRAGRFLWLDWAQAEVIAHEMDKEGRLIRITAEHNGYRQQGALMQRTLTSTRSGWVVDDAVLPYNKQNSEPHQAQLTWQLPDWPWQFINDDLLHLEGLTFDIHLQIEGAYQVNLYRAGQQLQGTLQADPNWGWIAPHYGARAPSLTLIAESTGKLPRHFRSTWQFLD